MNKIFYIFLIAGGLSLGFGSCDKVDKPIKPAIELDTTIFVGNWENYQYPLFEQNTNTDRNVLLEDYTGHRCLACPGAATIAQDIENANPNRVFVASIHASPGGTSTFQNLADDCGQASNPTDKYCTVFYCDEGIEYGNFFGSGYGFDGNPSGNVSRKVISPTMFTSASDWSANTATILNENHLKINLQAKSNYYPETNGFFLHTEAEFLEDLGADEYNMTVYLLENEVIDYQDVLGTPDPNYHHHNIFRGCIDGLPWGRPLVGEKTTGTKINLHYSYKLPDGKINSDFHLLIYVYNTTTLEVLQVIKHEF